MKLPDGSTAIQQVCALAYGIEYDGYDGRDFELVCNAGNVSEGELINIGWWLWEAADIVAAHLRNKTL